MAMAQNRAVTSVCWDPSVKCSLMVRVMADSAPESV